MSIAPIVRQWDQRLILMAWFASAVLLWQFGAWFSLPFQFVAVAVLAASFAYLFRRGWLRLFGPVFFYDAVRIGRQSRQIWLRLSYASLLGLILAWNYSNWYDFAETGNGTASIRDTATFAQEYFQTFIILQAIIIALLTPAYVAGAIADEKERKTLEFLLATDLRNREIIFGKLAARVGTLLLFILAGMPVLALMQFFGGIDPNEVIAAFAATLAGMISLSAVGIFASVVSKRVRDAIALAYLIPFAFFAASLLAQALRDLKDMSVPYTIFGLTFTGNDVLYALTCGNPIVGLIELEETRFAKGTAGSAVQFSLLGDFLLFHAVLTALCLAYSIRRMRTIALRQAHGGEPHKRGRRIKPRPQIGNQPMMWKEVFVETGIRTTAVGRFMIGLILLLTFVPPAILAWHNFIEEHYYQPWYSAETWRDFGRDMNVWVRVAGTATACLLLLAVAIRGAVSVRGEHERQTFDSLLTAPLSAKEILWGKWWGCMLGLRAAWAWLILLWVTGLATGALHVAALPGLIVAMVVFAGAFGWIGIWFSVVCRSTLRASLATLSTSLFVGGGYLILVGFCCIQPLRGDGEGIGQLALGNSPAVVLGWLPFRELTNRELRMDRVDFAPYAILGILVWVGVAALVSQLTITRFRQQINRH